MMEMYEYIKKNQGVLAVYIDTEDMLRRFRFTRSTEKLKKAIESSIEKCIATDLIDELLKSDVSVLSKVYNNLNQNGQSNIAAYFYEECPDSDKIFYEYTHAKRQCNILLPRTTKLHKNINNCIIILTQYIEDDDVIRLVLFLEDTYNVISNWQGHQIIRLKCSYGRQEAFKMLLTIITNMHQYNIFKLWCEMFCPQVLPYL